MLNACTEKRAPQNRVKYCVCRYYRTLLDLDLFFSQCNIELGVKQTYNLETHSIHDMFRVLV